MQSVCWRYSSLKKMCQLAMLLGSGVAFSTLFLELDEQKFITDTLEPVLILGHLS